MKKILDFLAKPSKLIYLVCAFAYAGLFAIATLGCLGGEFLPVISSLLVFLMLFAGAIAAPLLVVLHKEQAAKIVFGLVSAYWLVIAVQNNLGYTVFCQDGFSALQATIGVFGLLIGLCLLAVLVLAILSVVLKKELFKLVSILSLVGAFVFYFVMMVLLFVLYVKHETQWTNFIQLFVDLVAPAAILFGYLYFFGAPDADFPAPKAKKEEEQVEPVRVEEEAAPVEKAPEEEKPE